MSIRDDKKENDLIWESLLNEEEVGDKPKDDMAEDNTPQHYASVTEPLASEGEDQVQVGKNNEEEKADKASAAGKAILDMVKTLPLDQQASVWHAIVQDTNLAGRIIERWDHQLQEALIRILSQHQETDWLSDTVPPRPGETPMDKVNQMGGIHQFRERE